MMTPEVRAVTLAKLNAVQDRDQALTHARADRRYRRWTVAEDALVFARDAEAARNIALELGGTLYAVRRPSGRLAAVWPTTPMRDSGRG